MEKRLSYILLLGYFVIAFVALFLFNGTGDAGDSVLHYLYAKEAPDRPVLFFDHWAKPLFVLLSSPFAQFGFIGMKVFNILVTGASIWFTYKSAVALKLKSNLLLFVLYLCTPLTFIMTFSGLTEPLFALFISMGLYFSLRHQFVLACILLSFLPFIRSEGLIILGVYGFYLLLRRDWKMIPLLLVGHVVYSIAGAFVHGDILWVFTKIPYANLGSPYGSGDLNHFVIQLQYVVGIPIYILFWFGFVRAVAMIFSKQFNKELHVIVLGGFTAFFVAHSLFWYLGIFNSMGLNRVLIGVMPFIVLLALLGLDTITFPLVRRHAVGGKLLIGAITLLVVIFPFTSNPAAINWKKDMMLNSDQQCLTEVATFINTHYDKERRFIYMSPYLSELIGVEHFNGDQHVELNAYHLENSKPGDVFIWDNWFCVVERGILENQLDERPELTKIQTFIGDDDGRVIQYSVYLRK